MSFNTDITSSILILQCCHIVHQMSSYFLFCFSQKRTLLIVYMNMEYNKNKANSSHSKLYFTNSLLMLNLVEGILMFPIKGKGSSV